MEQMLILISKVCIVLVLILVSVVIEEYVSFNKESKTFISAGYLNGYEEETDYKAPSDRIVAQFIQGMLFAFFIYLDSTITMKGLAGVDIIYDAREVILNLSTVYGPIAVSITALASVMARIVNNPYSSAIPVICILSAYVMEIVYLYYLN